MSQHKDSHNAKSYYVRRPWFGPDLRLICRAALSTDSFDWRKEVKQRSSPSGPLRTCRAGRSELISGGSEGGFHKRGVTD